MKGETVIVRAYGNEPLVRRVWSCDEDVVFICTEENYLALESGHDALNPVGFLRNDVFEYDARRLKQLQLNYKTRPELWLKLMPWNGDDYGNDKQEKRQEEIHAEEG